MDRRNLPQQVSLVDGRIFRCQTVAACDEIFVFTQVAFAHDAMNKEPSVAGVEDEITFLGLLKIIGLNR